MATTKKSAGTTRKRAPRTAKQIHQGRATRNVIEEAEAEAAAEPTSAVEWKSKTSARKLKMPSGHTALVRNPGMDAFIEQGIIPNSLLQIVLAAVDENKPPSQRVLKDMANDPERIADVLKLANEIVLRCVVMPRVRREPFWTPEHFESGLCDQGDIGTIIPIGHPSRDETVLYVDEVDLNDRMFIFQWVVGGTHDLDQFREEQGAAMADLSSSEVVE